MITFDRLFKRINESSPMQLNSDGKELLQKYHALIAELEDQILPIIKDYVIDPDTLKKEVSIQIIATINSRQLGSDEFKLMSRLDTLTSGGKNTIDPNTYTFNQNDKVLNYLEKVS